MQPRPYSSAVAMPGHHRKFPILFEVLPRGGDSQDSPLLISDLCGRANPRACVSNARAPALVSTLLRADFAETLVTPARKRYARRPAEVRRVFRRARKDLSRSSRICRSKSPGTTRENRQYIATDEYRALKRYGSTFRLRAEEPRGNTSLRSRPKIFRYRGPESVERRT